MNSGNTNKPLIVVIAVLLFLSQSHLAGAADALSNKKPGVARPAVMPPGFDPIRDAKLKAEAEARARAQAEKAKAEAEKAKREAEAKARAEAAAKARLEKEMKDRLSRVMTPEARAELEKRIKERIGSVPKPPDVIIQPIKGKPGQAVAQ
ncbi:MAG: hypothetical protein NTY01_24095 [Verrucomicrobia bacterium]|nr:hypothetical protein [Verrucomicrobiota bacterium]